MQVKTELGMLTHAYNPSIWETEEPSSSRHQHQLYNKTHWVVSETKQKKRLMFLIDRLDISTRKWHPEHTNSITSWWVRKPQVVFQLITLIQINRN